MNYLLGRDQAPAVQIVGAGEDEAPLESSVMFYHLNGEPPYDDDTNGDPLAPSSSSEFVRLGAFDKIRGLRTIGFDDVDDIDIAEVGQDRYNPDRPLFASLADVVDEGVAVSRRSEAIMAVRIEPGTRASLRWMHTGLALAYALVALLSFLPFKEFTGIARQGFALFDGGSGRYRPGDVDAGPVRVDALATAFLLAPIVGHAAAALSLWNLLPFVDYAGMCERGINPLHWLGCALSLSLVTVAVAMVVGAGEVTTLVFVGVCTFALCLLCLSADFVHYYISTRSRAALGKVLAFDMALSVHLPLACVVALFACVWTVLVTYHVVSDDHDGALPRWAVACLYLGLASQAVVVCGEVLVHLPVDPTRRFLTYVFVSSGAMFVGNTTIAAVIFFANLK